MRTTIIALLSLVAAAAARAQINEPHVPDDGGAQDGSSTSDAGDGGVVCGSMPCSGCIPVIQRSCCKPNDTCGCMYIIGGPCN